MSRSSLYEFLRSQLDAFSERNVRIQMTNGNVVVHGARGALPDAERFSRVYSSELRAYFFRKNFSLLRLNSSAPSTLYCVPGYLGNSLVYRELARRLAGDVAVRSFHFDFVRALFQDALPICVAQIARAYRWQLTRSNDDGPYNLFGFSFGGVIAIELANQLLKSGRKISLLALGDTGPPWNFGEEPPWKQFVRTIADERVANHIDVLHAAQCISDQSRETRLVSVVELQRTIGSSKAHDRSCKELACLYEKYELYCRRLMSFEIPSYPGSFLFLQSRGEALDLLYKVRSAAQGGAITTIMPFSNHDQFVRPPGVADLATVMRCAVA